MRCTSRIVITLVLLAIAGMPRAGSEDEVKALFSRFVGSSYAPMLW